MTLLFLLIIRSPKLGPRGELIYKQFATCILNDNGGKHHHSFVGLYNNMLPMSFSFASQSRGSGLGNDLCNGYAYPLLRTYNTRDHSGTMLRACHKVGHLRKPPKKHP